MSKNYDLNLDEIITSSKKLKLGGKTFEVKQPGVQQLVTIFALADKLKNQQEPEESMQAMEVLLDTLDEIVPGLKKSKINMTSEQLMALMSFISDYARTQGNKVVPKVPGESAHIS